MGEYFLVFGDVDEDGKFTDVILGPRVIPDRQYEYFFFTMDVGVMEDISQYKVDLETRELIRISAPI